MSKEREFKIGDRVEINDGLHDGLVGTVLNKKMIDYDYYYTVELNLYIPNYTHDGDVQGHAMTCRYYAAYQLKYANDDNWKVVITPKGDTTLIRLYEDNKVVKSETVRRDVNDKYDKNVAIRESVNKLLGDQPVKPEEDPYPNGYLRWANDPESRDIIGTIGMFSSLKDTLGNELHVGDVVIVIEPMLNFSVEHGHHVVVGDEHGYHVQGCQADLGQFRYFKVIDWSEVAHATIIDGVEYITEDLDV